MEIQTTRFGDLDVPEESMIQFPRALYGLEGCHCYCFLPHDDRGGFFWLQSVDVPHLAMVLTDPFLHFPDYEVEIPDTAAEILGATEPGDVAIYTTVTVARDTHQIHANLLGPIAINHRRRCGIQLVQDGSRYTTRHLLGSSRTADDSG